MNKTRIIILCIVIAFVFAAGAAVTTYLVIKNTSDDEMYVEGERYNRLLKFFELDDIADMIDEYYYKELETDTLISGALKGFVEELNDGYSCFYPEEYFKYFDENTEGSYMGQGMLVDKDDNTGYIIVKRVFADTPAYEQNISAGNLITAIDGMDTSLMDTESAVSCLRGTDGTDITLSILAGNKEMEVSFIRKTPNTQVVFSDILENSIGYIDIAEFSGSSVSDFEKAVKTITDEGAKAVIIDIRDNPGGYISQASEIADKFLSSGDIYYTLNRTNEKFVISADEKCDVSLPVVVLVNENTKGAAEVFAAALKDNGAATLVGTTTNGKGAVLTTMQIPNTGDGLRLVSAYYYTPNGEAINKIGVAPHEKVFMDENLGDAQSDTQLQKAIEILSA
ncbi:MAG: S41 family peptidase [Christensenellaceae bacterium]|nr:S41 family peptidase [Christensenellaceae bacterium]